MNTNTKYFGTIPYEQQDILSLTEGLYGFEHCRTFLLIRFESDNPDLLCLQSLEEETLAFVLINPFSVQASYAPQPLPEDLCALGLNDDSEVSYYALCVIREPLDESTVNLKCPLLINPLTRHAKQIILEDYPLKHPFGHPMSR